MPSYATHGMSSMLAIRNLKIVIFLGFQRPVINHCQLIQKLFCCTSMPVPVIISFPNTFPKSLPLPSLPLSFCYSWKWAALLLAVPVPGCPEPPQHHGIITKSLQLLGGHCTSSVLSKKLNKYKIGTKIWVPKVSQTKKKFQEMRCLSQYFFNCST